MNSIKIKSILYNFIVFSMIFYVTTRIINGIHTSGQIHHLLLAFALFTLANLLIPHMLRFFTFPTTFFTYFLMSLILSFAAIYLMSLFFPGIDVGTTSIDPVGVGIVSVNPVTLTPIMTMVAGGAVAGFLSALLYWLNRD